jgi:hypothetical protein
MSFMDRYVERQLEKATIMAWNAVRAIGYALLIPAHNHGQGLVEGQGQV